MPIKLQRFKLVDTNSNIVEDSTFGTTWRDTWDYECPSKMMILLQNGDLFSLKAYDSADVEYVAPDAEIKIEVRDAAGQKKILVYGPANYISSKEFQEKKKMAKLRLDKKTMPDGITVKPRDHIVFMTKDTTGMDSASVDTSYCRLMTSRVVTAEGGRL